MGESPACLPNKTLSQRTVTLEMIRECKLVPAVTHKWRHLHQNHDVGDGYPAGSQGRGALPEIMS